MRMINELIIRGEPPEIAKLVERIEAAPSNGWKREPVIEERLGSPRSARPSTYCFATPTGPDQPAAYLILEKKLSGGLYVSDIMPIDRKPLTDEQYNAILYRFDDNFLKPVSLGVKVEARIDPFRVKMEKIISRAALEKLYEFSKSAEEFRIGRHDRNRWSRFVTQVHIDNSALDSEELDWWLASRGWPEEQRLRLIEWYEEGLSMLKEYDEERVG